MIVCAAVKCGDTIYEGRRHSDAIMAAVQAAETTPITQNMQGFVDDHGHFYSRRDAWKIAVKCGQVEPKPDGRVVPLFSEDLY